MLKAIWIALHFITTTIQFKSSPKEVPGHEIFLKNQSIIIINMTKLPAWRRIDFIGADLMYGGST